MTIPPLRIGVIGGGVSGIAAAWMLQDQHRVTLLEKEPRFGGHAETVPVTLGGKTIHAELGPRFFFNPSYPYFLGLLRLLGVPIRWNDAIVSVTDVPRRRSIVVPPRSPAHVLSLLRSPQRLRHLISLRRLVGEQRAVFAERDYSIPFHRYLAQGRYPDAFGPEFAYPFLAACWGTRVETIADFPAYSLLKGMPPGDKAGFFEVEGGMSFYMAAFGRELSKVDVRLGTSVRRIARVEPHYVVEDERGEQHSFDQLIVATSSRDAAALLREVPAATAMQAAIAGFRHFETQIAVHGDAAFMPPLRRNWGHINLFFDRDAVWMSDWPGLREKAPVMRTWLPKGRPTPSPLYATRTYHHLIMTPENAILQQRIASVQGAAGLWVTGMYTADVDNHESALLSAVVPVRALAPDAPNLGRFLGAVAKDAAHGLEVLPVPLTAAAS